MKARIIVAAIFVPLIFVLLLILPPVWLTIFIMAVAGLSGFELMRATGEAKNLRLAVYAAVSAAVIVLGHYFSAGDLVFRADLAVLMALVFAEAIAAFGKERRLKTSDVTMTLFAGAVIPYCLACIVSLKCMENGRFLVFFPFIVTMISDAGAYFVGLYFGKKKIFPHVSPKKTLEGCIGGLASALVFTLIFGLIIKLAAGLQVNFAALVVYALVGNAFTQLGDLAFSFVKREFSIKDYGKLLPGHGGMLDRFDSMIFAAPAIYVLVMVFPAF